MHRSHENAFGSESLHLSHFSHDPCPAKLCPQVEVQVGWKSEALHVPVHTASLGVHISVTFSPNIFPFLDILLVYSWSGTWPMIKRSRTKKATFLWKLPETSYKVPCPNDPTDPFWGSLTGLCVEAKLTSVLCHCQVQGDGGLNFFLVRDIFFPKSRT